MKDELVQLTYEIELQPGEQLRLPETLVAAVGPGRWRLTLRPVRLPQIRSHDAFLSSYAQEDEGVYDAYSAR